MKIFLSYGHDDNTPLVLRIKAALEAAGHQIWIDSTQITPGADWRRAISQGVLGCQKTVAMLSRHSVRDPGVCRDELVIALADGGEQSILTILLENEKDVAPPLLVSHIQWIDMSVWREMRAQGEGIFEVWFADRIAQILGALEESKGYEGEIEELRSLLQISPVRMTWVQRMAWILRRGIVGREWLLEEIRHWLEEDGDEASRVFCLTGGPGIGKSALSAYFAAQNKAYVAAMHFCQPVDTLQDILLSLAFQLGTRLPDYRAFLLHALRNLPPEKSLMEYSPDELFDFLLHKAPHIGADGGRRRYAMLVDGLDEGNGELARLLAQKVSTLPFWLRVIVTSRPHDAHVRPYLAAMSPRVLNVNDERNQSDLRLWIDGWLAEQGIEGDKKSEYARTLLERSEGTFLYLSMFRDMVEKQPELLSSPHSYPRGFAALYAASMERIAPDTENYRRELRPFLRFLAAARRPLPVSLLNRILHRQNQNLSRQAVQEDLLPRLGSYVVLRDGLVSPFHKSLTDWLSSDESGRFKASALDGHAALAGYFYTRGSLAAESAPALETNYITSEFPYHLLMWCNAGNTYTEYAEKMGLARTGTAEEALDVIEGLDLSHEKWSRDRERRLEAAREAIRFHQYGEVLDWPMCVARLDVAIFGAQSAQTASSLNIVAEALLLLGDYDTALHLAERALSINEQVHGQEHPAVADSAFIIGQICSHPQLWEYRDRAVKSHEQALHIRQKTLGAEHPNTARSLQALDALKNEGGFFNQLFSSISGDSLSEEALAIQEKNFPADHPDIAVTLLTLAKKYGDHDFGNSMEHIEKACQFAERALAIREKVFGPEHPLTDDCVFILAGLYRQVSRDDAAFRLLERSLHFREKKLESGHEGITSVLMAMAYYFKQMGDIKSSLQYAGRALANKHVRSDDFDAIVLVGHVAACLGQGYDEEAIDIYEKALDRCDLISLHDRLFNEAYARIGKNDAVARAKGAEARRRRLERAVDERIRELGDGHLDVAKSLEELAAFERQQGENEKARELYEHALGIRAVRRGPLAKDARETLLAVIELNGARHIIDPDHPLDAITLEFWIKALQTKGADVPHVLYVWGKDLFWEKDDNIAALVLARAAAIAEEILGFEHERTQSILLDHAEKLRQLKQFDGALAIFERIFTLRQSIHGDAHLNTADILYEMCEVLLYGKKDFDASQQINERLIVIYDSIYGRENKKTVDCLYNLGNIAEGKGEFSRALSLYKESWIIAEKICGLDALPTIYAKLNQALLLRRLGEHELALPLFVAYQEALERIHGQEAAKLANPLKLLAFTYQNLHHNEEAAALFARALHIDNVHNGPAAEETLICRRNLADAREDLGDVEGACALHEENLALAANAFGPDHSICANSLRLLYILNGEETEDPIQLFSAKSLPYWERALGPDDPETAKQLAAWGQSLLEKDDREVARLYLERASAMEAKFTCSPTTSSMQKDGLLFDVSSDKQTSHEKVENKPKGGLFSKIFK